MQRDRNQGNHLPGNLIDDHKSGVFLSALTGHGGGRRDSNQRDQQGCDDFNRDQPFRRHQMQCGPPAQHGNAGSIRAGARLQMTNAKKRGDEPCPSRSLISAHQICLSYLWSYFPAFPGQSQEWRSRKRHWPICPDQSGGNARCRRGSSHHRPQPATGKWGNVRIELSFRASQTSRAGPAHWD